MQITVGVGLPEPVLRVTSYLAPGSCVLGGVQPIVIACPLAVAVAFVGADRLAATATAGFELSLLEK